MVASYNLRGAETDPFYLWKTTFSVPFRLGLFVGFFFLPVRFCIPRFGMFEKWLRQVWYYSEVRC